MNGITVLLADDHRVVLAGFRKLLEGEPDVEVVGEAHTGRQAVAMARKLRPEVIVMDIAMPRLNGLEATRQIRKVAPECKVLILSAHSDDAYVDRAIESGASGFLLKLSSASTVSSAIREIHKGNTFFNASLIKRLRDQKPSISDGPIKKKLACLSSREMEVLQLVAEGKANKETAAELGIGIKTVEKHREHLMKKLDIHDTAGLTRYAISAGIIESSVQLAII